MSDECSSLIAHLSSLSSVRRRLSSVPLHQPPQDLPRRPRPQREPIPLPRLAEPVRQLHVIPPVRLRDGPRPSPPASARSRAIGPPLLLLPIHPIVDFSKRPLLAHPKLPAECEVVLADALAIARTSREQKRCESNPWGYTVAASRRTCRIARTRSRAAMIAGPANHPRSAGLKTITWSLSTHPASTHVTTQCSLSRGATEHLRLAIDRLIKLVRAILEQPPLLAEPPVLLRLPIRPHLLLANLHQFRKVPWIGRPREIDDVLGARRRDLPLDVLRRG